MKSGLEVEFVLWSQASGWISKHERREYAKKMTHQGARARDMRPRSLSGGKMEVIDDPRSSWITLGGGG